uniref:Uncharacterized protein n=1 Tax=Onchocerca volvulus TaxID=6282 RepID=A0A8R1TWS3_ONCVO
MEITGNDGKTKEQLAVSFKLPEIKQKMKSSNFESTRDFVKEKKKLQTSIRNKQNLMKEWNRFRVLYDNGHLPVRLEQRGTGKPSRNIRWLENPKLISAERFMDLLIKFSCVLPLLEYPYRLIAEQGVIDLLKNYVNNESVIQCLPQLVRPPEITKKTMALSLIIQLAQIPQCCPALIPYFRHLFLPLRKHCY